MFWARIKCPVSGQAGIQSFCFSFFIYCYNMDDIFHNMATVKQGYFISYLNAMLKLICRHNLSEDSSRSCINIQAQSIVKKIFTNQYLGTYFKQSMNSEFSCTILLRVGGWLIRKIKSIFSYIKSYATNGKMTY